MSTTEAGNTSQTPFYDASETGGSAPTAPQDRTLPPESEQQASEAIPDSANLPFPGGAPTETFHVKNGGWGWKNSYVYLDEDGNSPAFFADCSQLKRLPDLVVYRGSNEQSEILGGATFRRSKDSKLLLGADASEWANYQEDSLLKDEVFELIPDGRSVYLMSIPASANASQGGRQVKWERTKSAEHGVRGLGKYPCCSKTMYNYLITDQANDKVLGVYLQHPKVTFTRRGKLVLRADVDQQMKDCLLLAGLTLAEKARRRAAQIAAGATAGSQAGAFAGVY
ncbi:hypothetical protein KC343_g13667 [Hortaea werneckii]|uniref:Uncharacterized protein n=1 Tax=Hortaea werneckii TaxID=91943 RepID=A0A3M7EXC4_HORWE|nr:hypothetical protein KC352_g28063 [Hortaea werneckii]KAI7552166.1 hypothetical protein KC317_g13820 [Hortaea werneckii]KAI7599825.1 hypothetical protein KC346_g13556 [Hortaea werneckii]KAI7605658.1 hypothetical protein KC343_g13667 [Hortaea werneckii]KAI7641683.1 hypothetical protein KC319_g13386 [Hortaea werneckii]